MQNCVTLGFVVMIRMIFQSQEKSELLFIILLKQIEAIIPKSVIFIPMD